jgi:hypothetical protein
MTIVIHGAAVATVDADDTVIYDGAVAVEADRIVAVGASRDVLARYPDAERLDGSGKAIMPGFAAHVRRPGRDADADAPVRHAVAPGMEGLNPRKAALAEPAVDLERRRITDRALGLVPSPLGEQEAHAGGGHLLDVGLDAGGVLEDCRAAAADGL